MPFAEQHTLKPAGVQAPRLRRLLAYLVITHRLVARPPAPAPAGEEEAYVLIEQLGCYEREEPPLAQEDASFSQVGTAPGLAVYLKPGHVMPVWVSQHVILHHDMLEAPKQACHALDTQPTCYAVLQASSGVAA